MKSSTAMWALVATLGVAAAKAQDWPQWRGANRDARATEFKAPKTWPKELTQKWKVTVGEGVATPALVGDKIFVFSRETGNEVLRCLAAADGRELWQDKYETLGVSGPAGSFSGPRSSPAVAEGRVVTLGVRGMISCLEAGTGKKLWRKDEFNAYPMFHPSSSPMIVDGAAIAQLGGRENGAIVAYDLTTGAQKWKWSGSSPAYASPVLVTVGGSRLILAQTEAKTVAVNAADGQLVWESATAPQGGGPGGGGPGAAGGGGGRGMGGGRDNKSATPIVDGSTVIIAGHGMKAFKFEKEGGKVTAREIWANAEKSVQFSTPTLKAGKLFGLAGNNELFCLDAKDGRALWSAPFPGSPAPSGLRGALEKSVTMPLAFGLVAQEPPTGGGRPGGPGGQGGPGGPGGGGRRGGRRGGGMGGGGGYGSIVDAGSVLLALTPAGQLVIFEPSDKEFKQVASYKVAAGQTHSYPIVSGSRIFIKDKDTLTLWALE